MPLGRGLDSLIPSKDSVRMPTPNTVPAEGEIVMIAISEIEPNPFQPRRKFDRGELESLADSIKDYGLLQPIVVTAKDGGGYYTIAGERRLRAVQLLGEDEIAAMLRTADDHEQLELALIENVQREDLNPIEEAWAYRRLIDEFGLRQKDICERLGKSRPVVCSILSLLKLPEEIQQELLNGSLSYAKARTLALSLGDEPPEKIVEMWQEAQREGMDTRELERKAARKDRKKKKRTLLDPVLEDKEKELEEIFGTKVRIKNRGDRGSIKFEFFSNEELREAIERLLSLG